LDQAGQGLWLRCAGLVLRCPAGGLHGTPPAPWPRGPRRYHAQDGGQVEASDVRGGFLENHSCAGETERRGDAVVETRLVASPSHLQFPALKWETGQAPSLRD